MGIRDTIGGGGGGGNFFFFFFATGGIRCKDFFCDGGSEGLRDL